MTRVCTICRHPERELIEKELVRGEPLRNIALTYRIGYSSLGRHRKDHMIITDENGAPVVMRLQDVIDIPLSMKERSALTKALIDRALEPLMGRGGSIDDIQTGFVARLLKLQQDDEQTILKMTGVLKEKDISFAMPGHLEERDTPSQATANRHKEKEVQENIIAWLEGLTKDMGKVAGLPGSTVRHNDHELGEGADNENQDGDV